MHAPSPESTSSVVLRMVIHAFTFVACIEPTFVIVAWTVPVSPGCSGSSAGSTVVARSTFDSTSTSKCSRSPAEVDSFSEDTAISMAPYPGCSAGKAISAFTTLIRGKIRPDAAKRIVEATAAAAAGEPHRGIAEVRSIGRELDTDCLRCARVRDRHSNNRHIARNEDGRWRGRQSQRHVRGRQISKAGGARDLWKHLLHAARRELMRAGYRRSHDVISADAGACAGHVVMRRAEDVAELVGEDHRVHAGAKGRLNDAGAVARAAELAEIRDADALCGRSLRVRQIAAREQLRGPSARISGVVSL